MGINFNFVLKKKNIRLQHYIRQKNHFHFFFYWFPFFFNMYPLRRKTKDIPHCIFFNNFLFWGRWEGRVEAMGKGCFLRSNLFSVSAKFCKFCFDTIPHISVTLRVLQVFFLLFYFINDTFLGACIVFKIVSEDEQMCTFKKKAKRK